MEGFWGPFTQVISVNKCVFKDCPRFVKLDKVYKVYKDKAFSQELRLLACS